jgi:Immunoglobulin domain/Galactose oxidase, central domain
VAARIPVLIFTITSLFISIPAQIVLAESPAWLFRGSLPGFPSEPKDPDVIHDAYSDALVMIGDGYPWTEIRTWQANGGWSTYVPLGPPPTSRWFKSVVHDAARNDAWLFGGFYFRITNNETWRLSLGGGSWTRVYPMGSPPSPRQMHSAILDPVGDRMIVYGGAGASGTALADVLSLSLGGSPAWSAMSPSGDSPPGRNRHVAIYDPLGKRMIVFGGQGSNDVWALSLDGDLVWRDLTPTGVAPPISIYFGVYDFDRHELIVLDSQTSDLWILSLVEPLVWLPVELTGPHPTPPRDIGALLYEASPSRLFFFGGWLLSNPTEFWSIDLPLCPAPMIASHPTGQTVSAGSTVVFEVDVDGPGSPTYRWRRNGRPLVDDGRRSGTDTATLTVSPAGTFDGGSYDVVVREACATTVSAIAELIVIQPTGVDIPSLPASLILDAPAPNPASRAVSIAWAQPRRAPVQVSVYDIFGHEVARLADTELEAGRHERTWVVGAGSPANSAGVYFVRVRCDGREINRKVTVLE